MDETNRIGIRSWRHHLQSDTGFSEREREQETQNHEYVQQWGHTSSSIEENYIMITNPQDVQFNLAHIIAT